MNLKTLFKSSNRPSSANPWRTGSRHFLPGMFLIAPFHHSAHMSAVVVAKGGCLLTTQGDTPAGLPCGHEVLLPLPSPLAWQHIGQI